tara:strand:+ start:626 stop:1306 length:681 start_codon:yes stop_codon:yes gene_type:complete
MDFNKSMASNHLSEAATKGRYGDDVLVHMSKNEVKSLANMAGMDDLPRNPSTGLPEAWIFAAASLGMSLYQGAKGTSMGRDAANTQLSLIRNQRKDLESQKESLGQNVGAQKQAATAQFEQGLEGLSAKTGMQKEDIMEGYNKTMQQSGLVTSAGAEEGRKKMWDRVGQSFGMGKENLYNELSIKMGEAEGFLESETERIDAEDKRLAAEQKLQRQQSQQKFLGIF